MPLIPGTRIGHYEVIDLLGEGGMGAVYRARDTKLQRDVAMKVLRPEVADDPERLARFQREAQVLAALNHPHIGAIHGLEESSGTIALVLELVDGPTLADRIAQGPIALDEALAIARQIAEALEAAHEQGLIHRDLKPANIKVRDDGAIKVLDFGLAKALQDSRTSGPQDLVNSPTITSPAMTMRGVILGTAAYMAPEQAKGRTVDKRADIWSFGVVLYEMLTGKRLFDGDDLTEVLAAVVRMEPDLSTILVSTRRLLAKCLEKDPRRRLRDIGDWQELLDKAAPVAAPQAPSRAGRLPLAVATLATILLAAVSLMHFREAAPQSPLTRTSLLPPDEATWTAASQTLSPDGRRMAFIATDNDNRQQLFVRSFDAQGAQPLAGTEGAFAPFWSRDGNSLAFFARGKLNRVDVRGGLPLALADVTYYSRGGTWGRDGTIVYAANNLSGLTKISADGGQPAAATTLRSGETSHRWPWFLPDGHHFLFADGIPGAGNPMDIWIASIDSPDRQKLLTANSAAAFASGPDGSGYLLYLRESTLVAQPFDTRGLKTTGVAAPVAERVTVSGAARAAFSVSGNGVLSFTDSAADDKLVWVDRTGSPLATLRGLDRIPAGFTLSPDDRTLAYESRDDIWLYDMERQVRTRFTTDPGRDGGLPSRWSTANPPKSTRRRFQGRAHWCEFPRRAPAALTVTDSFNSAPTVNRFCTSTRDNALSP